MAAILKVPKVPICKPPVYEVDTEHGEFNHQTEIKISAIENKLKG